jgi:hypothetical protein
MIQDCIGDIRKPVWQMAQPSDFCSLNNKSIFRTNAVNFCSRRKDRFSARLQLALPAKIRDVLREVRRATALLLSVMDMGLLELIMELREYWNPLVLLYELPGDDGE